MDTIVRILKKTFNYFGFELNKTNDTSLLLQPKYKAEMTFWKGILINYEEWFDDVEEGWIALINFHEHVLKEFERINIDHYFVMGGELEDIEWRTYQPHHFYKKVNDLVTKRLV